MARIYTPSRTVNPTIEAACDALLPHLRAITERASALEIALGAFRAATPSLGAEAYMLNSTLDTYKASVESINRRHAPAEKTVVETLLAEARRPRGPVHLLRWSLLGKDQPAELIHCTETHAFYLVGWRDLRGFSLVSGLAEGDRPGHGHDELTMPASVRAEVKKMMGPWLAKQKTAKAKRQALRNVSRGHVR